MELAVAKPALMAAQEAVNCLDKGSLTELKSFSKVSCVSQRFNRHAEDGKRGKGCSACKYAIHGHRAHFALQSALPAKHVSKDVLID